MNMVVWRNAAATTDVRGPNGAPRIVVVEVLQCRWQCVYIAPGLLAERRRQGAGAMDKAWCRNGTPMAMCTLPRLLVEVRPRTAGAATGLVW